MNYVKCERMDDFGRGIVYIDGKICFVDNLLPFEEAYVEIILNKKKYSVGKIVFLEKESIDRIHPNCPYLRCGCSLKHLKYEKQLEFKEQKVLNIMKKYAGLDIKIKKIIPSDQINGYRNKITLKSNGSLGFHENGSNEIITINKCELVSEKVNKIIKILNTMDLSRVLEIVIKEFDGIMIIIKGSMDVEPLKKHANSIYMNDKLVYGDEFVQTKIGDLIFNVSKDSFFQVNSGMVQKLYDLAISYCGVSYDKKVLDLYCGTGTISLLLSKHFKEVIGIEINKEAVLCANMNKKLNNVDNVSFINGDVSKKIKDLKADIVLVDPPRSGLTKKAIDDILKINPFKIVYISCDPMTLARDLKILKELYEIKEITPVDMFPNTYHVETVTLLVKK